MTIKRNDEIQEGIVAYLKGKTAITSLLYAADEIREDHWKGTVSGYPNVRVDLVSNTPTADCDKSQFTARLLVFDEEASSQDADHIAGIIANILHGKGWSSSGVAFTTRVTNLIPAIAQDQTTWRSEVLIVGSAS